MGALLRPGLPGPPPPSPWQTRAELRRLERLTRHLDDASRQKVAYWDAGAPAYRWIDVKLYVYVSRQLANDPVRTAVINQHRRDMLEDSRLILDFLRTYGAARFDDAMAGLGQTEFLAMGAALVQRIEREENTLYPLYQASY